jgi:hypothetical protein
MSRLSKNTSSSFYYKSALEAKIFLRRRFEVELAALTARHCLPIAL